MSKRGTSNEDALSSKKPKPLKCILPVNAKDHFIALRDVKIDAAKKLSSLHQIRGIRLAEPK